MSTYLIGTGIFLLMALCFVVIMYIAMIDDEPEPEGGDDHDDEDAAGTH